MSAPKRGKQLGIWVGSSRELEAETPSIQAAIQDAYDQASRDPDYDQASRDPEGGLQLKVVATYVIGTNPITEYRVELGPA